MSNVVYLSTHPRCQVKASDYDELTIQNAPSMTDAALRQHDELMAQGKVLLALKKEAEALMDEAFRARALGQESVGKLKEETAKYLLSLVASLPTKLRAQ